MFSRNLNAKTEVKISFSRNQRYLGVILVLSGLALAACVANSTQLNGDPPRTSTPLVVSKTVARYQVRQEASELFFLDERRGWALSNGLLYGTSDGGDHWKILNRMDPRDSIEVTFVTDHEGWAILNQWSGRHHHLVLRTEDGGHSWRTLLNLESPISTIDFVNQDLGYVRGHWDELRRTSNRGKTWESLTFAEGEAHLGLFEGLQHVFFFTEKEGWGYGSAIWHTTDGAETWTNSVPDEKINGILGSASFVDDKHGWVVGSGREIWRTTDGMSWQRSGRVPTAEGEPKETTRTLPDKFYSVSFIDTREGWVAANDKTVLHSSDGGESWEIVCRVTSNIRALRFLSPTHGCAIDEDNRILRTVDGGRSWNIQSTD